MFWKENKTLLKLLMKIIKYIKKHFQDKIKVLHQGENTREKIPNAYKYMLYFV